MASVESQSAPPSISISDATAPDFQFMGQILYEAFTHDPYFTNSYPKAIRPATKEEFGTIWGNKYRADWESGKCSASSGVLFRTAHDPNSERLVGFAIWWTCADWKEDGLAPPAPEPPTPGSKAEIALSRIKDEKSWWILERETWNQRNKEYPDCQPHWLLGTLCVLPQYQRLGIGKSLVNDGLRLVASDPVFSQSTNPSCFVQASPPAYRFYEKLGFRKTGEARVKGTNWEDGMNGNIERDDEGWWFLEPMMRRDLEYVEESGM